MASSAAAPLTDWGPSVQAAAVRDRLGRGPVYVSVDIDVLDPPTHRGRHPRSGGMTSRELFGLVRSLKDPRSSRPTWSEVAPAYDHAR